MNRGAIILCGGRSSRIATDKALLPFGDETMLQRVARIVGSVVDSEQIVVVAANQVLPTLSPSITIVRDQVEYQGPLPALACGLAALTTTETAFITGCDAPLLSPKLIEYLFAQLGDADAVVPQDADRLYPLCAVYRTRIVENIERQITTTDHSLHGLIAQLSANRIPVDLLLKVDPQLYSLRNVNSREDYVAAIAVAGFSTP